MFRLHQGSVSSYPNTSLAGAYRYLVSLVPLRQLALAPGVRSACLETLCFPSMTMCLISEAPHRIRKAPSPGRLGLDKVFLTRTCPIAPASCKSQVGCDKLTVTLVNTCRANAVPLCSKKAVSAAMLRNMASKKKQWVR